MLSHKLYDPSLNVSASQCVTSVVCCRSLVASSPMLSRSRQVRSVLLYSRACSDKAGERGMCVAPGVPPTCVRLALCCLCWVSRVGGLIARGGLRSLR